MHNRYASDRENIAQVTALVLHVGGPEGPHAPGAASGIHWHVEEGNQIRYRHLDRGRREIAEVVLATPDGEVRYMRDTDADTAAGFWRVMDCLDCHNRPTHIYQLPHRAVDLALGVGQLDPSVPWLRREGERVLRELEPDHNTAARVAEALRDIYSEEHPEDLDALEANLEPTVETLTRILERNVWPAMNITWGTYPQNLSHFDTDGEFSTGGCFRCHDAEMETAAGAVIDQDCDACHALLAVEEPGWEGLEGLDAAAFLQR